jgi:hypothetical protein
MITEVAKVFLTAAKAFNVYYKFKRLDRKTIEPLKRLIPYTSEGLFTKTNLHAL